MNEVFLLIRPADTSAAVHAGFRNRTNKVPMSQHLFMILINIHFIFYHIIFNNVHHYNKVQTSYSHKV